MDTVTQRMLSATWLYADKDRNALVEIEGKLLNAGRWRVENFINYSDLVQGIVFSLPTVHHGEPFEIDTYEWPALHRSIIGDFLGFISVYSYTKHGFMASCLGVSKKTMMPSEFFLRFHV